MNNNCKNNILILENVRQKRVTILKYFDACICHHYRLKCCASKYSRIFSLFSLIFFDIKMLSFELLFILYVLKLPARNGFKCIKWVQYICHYWCFLNYSFKFHSNACNRFQDLLMMSINLGNIAILNIKGSDYHCIISLISKNETIKFL